jgi:hypothetical protein
VGGDVGLGHGGSVMAGMPALVVVSVVVCLVSDEGSRWSSDGGGRRRERRCRRWREFVAGRWDDLIG